ncbi:MAG: hypothetical protein R2712_29245 [Vicinamibacterales bacterium]
MTLTAAGRTDIGPRALNQDWLEWDLDLGLFVVADGMGGHNAGEVACISPHRPSAISWRNRRVAWT